MQELKKEFDQYGTKLQGKFKNSIKKLYLDRKDRLWVQTSVADAEDNIAMDIFEEGIFLKRITLPFSTLSWFSLHGKWFKVFDPKENTLTIYEY